MAGNSLCTRNFLRLAQTLPRTKCWRRAYIALSTARYLSASNRPFLACFPNEYLLNINESSSLTGTEVRSKSWMQQYEDFVYQLNTQGLDNLDSKFLPVKRRKLRAPGETSIHFVDFTRVKVTAGNGGDGNIHFMQIFKNPNAGPSGGDGGNGGHLIFKASKNLKSLNRVEPVLTAQSGEAGKRNDCNGKNAPNLIVEVPIGTVFKYNGTEVADLEEEGDMFIAARGGAGGKGNSFFANSVDQAPMIAECGGQGESFNYEVELRIMADIGLIGVPNAGKSTLLRAISRARPKVAAYPFTTLNPHVGMVEFGDYHQIAVADLPGLVEGSHANLGLGMEFLKHVQRCSCLLFVLDASEENPLQQFSILRNELEHYESGLFERPHAVILNKMDLPQAQEKLLLIQNEVKFPVFPISAKMGQNLVQLIAAMRLLSECNSAAR